MMILKRAFFVVGLLLFLVSRVSAADGQIPRRFQKRLLNLAPQADTDGDGQMSVEELTAHRDQLPAGLQNILDIALETRGRSAGKPTAVKHTPVKVGAPEQNGPTPFLDPMFQYTETENIQYATAKSGDTEMPLLLDVYRATESADLPKTLPAMIILFGGGWIKGSKDTNYIRDLSEYYATRGYVAISIQYRIMKDNPPALPGPAPTPETIERFRLMNAAIQDTANAVRWVRTNPDSYNIDPDRIGIGGVSAGAFNSLYTGFCDESIIGPNAEVAAVISLMGAIESKHIDKDDPPVFIAHETRDNTAPYAMVESMVRRLDEVKAAYVLYPVGGLAHRLQTILDTKFGGKTVREHSIDFCFSAMKLSELLAKND